MITIAIPRFALKSIARWKLFFELWRPHSHLTPTNWSSVEWIQLHQFSKSLGSHVGLSHAHAPAAR